MSQSPDSHQGRERADLARGEVHVFRHRLATLGSTGLEALLSPEELARAARFRTETDRSRFVSGRGALRRLLGQYTGAPAERLELIAESGGKLRLASELGRLRFNVAHAGDLALFAVAWERDVGIDVERIVLDPDAFTEIIEQLSVEEQAAVRGFPEHRRGRAFFACWVRKEAYLKARGLGLALPLSDFDVSVDPDAPAQLLATRDPHDDVNRWSLSSLAIDAGYMAALCTEGQGLVLRQFDLEEPNDG